MYNQKTKTQIETVTQENDRNRLPVRGECIKTKDTKTSDRNTKSGREPKKGLGAKTDWLAVRQS